jgi:cold shock CspA family protein
MQSETTKPTGWMNGIVHWFDELSGEGVIKDTEGQSYFVHYSAIESDKKWKNLKDKQKVQFKIVKDYKFTQVSHVKGLK